MKSIMLMTATLLMSGSCINNVHEKDAVSTATAINEIKAVNGNIDDEVAVFLVKSADACLMSSQEAKLAVIKGTTPLIKEYGKLLMKDQTALLIEIKKLAAEKNVTLPSTISENREEEHDELTVKNGKDFDEKFIKMMYRNQRQNVKLFENAIEYRDKDISAFASKYLPVIQSHLDNINGLQKEEN